VKLYVVTAPESIRGIYETWDACRAAVSGVRGARYQAVSSRAQAEALLSGEGLRLTPGRYAFVDGNAMGGIGVVLVERDATATRVVEEIGTTVYTVFGPARIPGLDGRPKITRAVDRLRNVLAELGALYLALTRAAPGPLTVVHDYQGVGAWMEGRWQTKDPLVAEVVGACRDVVRARGLTLAFRHQKGHESTFAGPNDWAAFNARADRLATDAALRAD
jgi:Caulimovirus viroplasmin